MFEVNQSDVKRKCQGCFFFFLLLFLFLFCFVFVCLFLFFCFCIVPSCMHASSTVNILVKNNKFLICQNTVGNTQANLGLAMIFAGQENKFIIFRSRKYRYISKQIRKSP